MQTHTQARRQRIRKKLGGCVVQTTTTASHLRRGQETVEKRVLSRPQKVGAAHRAGVGRAAHATRQQHVICICLFLRAAAGVSALGERGELENGLKLPLAVLPDHSRTWLIACTTPSASPRSTGRGVFVQPGAGFIPHSLPAIQHRVIFRQTRPALLCVTNTTTRPFFLQTSRPRVDIYTL